MRSRRRPRKSPRLIGAVALAAAVDATVARAATVTLSNTAVGLTPRFLGYSMGHYMPGSNTSAWFAYSGANAFRYWGPASDFEPTDDAAPYGDGIASLADFNSRKTALRVNPESSTYINWSYFNSKFANTILSGRNSATFNYPMGELQKMGVDTLLQST